jgi:hypothetical protein
MREAGVGQPIRDYIIVLIFAKLMLTVKAGADGESG